MKTLFISLLTLELLFSCGKSDNSHNEQLKLIQANLIASTDNKWELDKTLIITFLDGTSEQIDEVTRFAPEWTKYANLNFKFYPSLHDIPAGEKPDITITFNGQGNNSDVGTDSKRGTNTSRASMSLSGLSPTHFHLRRGTILHEFGHAIGLQHEHQHPERTFKFTNESTAIAACAKAFKFSASFCKEFVIKTMSKSKSLYFSTYDPLSVMHYDLHSAFFSDKASMRNNMSLSLLDKLEIAKLYPGRVTQEDIIKEHNEIMTDISMLSYKNCHIEDQLEEVSRFDSNGVIKKIKVQTYKIVSNERGEFYTGFAEDRESMIFYMKNEPYCNTSEEVLHAQRVEKAQKRKTEFEYGNCLINLDDDGFPAPKTCEDKKTFEVVRKSSLKDLVVQSCFFSFEEAVKAQKAAEYCNLSASEALRADEALEKQKKIIVEQKIRPACEAADNNVQKVKNGCGATNSFYLYREDKNVPVNQMCFQTQAAAKNAIPRVINCK